ncbi:MAG: VanW family protein [Candidatus Moranbacteria bacterium]|nr:VanW family protein [Candidatus Moranbacteria bacterium]
MKISAPHSSRSPITKTLILGAVCVGIFFPYKTSAVTLNSLVIRSGDYTETVSSPTISAFTRLDTHLAYTPPALSEVENTAFCPAQKLFCDFSLSRYTSRHLHNTLFRTTDTPALKEFIVRLAERINQDPVDVVFSAEGDRVIVAELEKVGRRLQEKESLELLANALQNTETETIRITLPTEVTQAKLVAADRERLGLRELVGEGRTNFKGSPKNRIYNIKRALEQFQNVIIAPGEEFSFVKYLGEVDGEHGYLPELVIKNNQTTPEFGGGICQVSTTVFRAAIYSGMKITERRNHAYPVKYYTPYGMDATVYIPKPDLGFTNNTPGAILMQSTINDTELTFRFYGTKDGRTVTVDGPHILQRGGDGSMKTVFSQLVTDATGESLINDSFWSNYKSPSLFPHPGEEPVFATKPKGWSEKQWSEYKKIHP